MTVSTPAGQPSATDNPSASTDREWIVVGVAADIAKRKKVVAEIDGRQVLVIAHEGAFFAFDNICQHRERELSKGVILNGKIVCPGHQWAFALDTGWEAVKQVCQTTYPVRLAGDNVELCPTPKTTSPTTPTSPTSTAATETPVVNETTAERDEHSVRTWVDGWGAEVGAVDLAAARLRFADDVSAFGTHADVVVGRDRLEAEQWSPIWPAIEDFRFLTDEMQVIVSADRLLAVTVVGWTSIGIASDGGRFDRPGRATIVLARESVEAPWRGSHTHFSLGRGVPRDTYGSRPAIR